MAQKTLATPSAAKSGTVGGVIPMPSPQLQVAEQFLNALGKLTGDYSTVVKLKRQVGFWSLWPVEKRRRVDGRKGVWAA